MALLLGALCVTGCHDEESPTDPNVHMVGEIEASLVSTSVGDPLPGIDPSVFAVATEVFDETETIVDGLGPLFNERSCGACHSTPVVGGWGEQIERRFGLMLDGLFYGYDGEDDNHGGTLRQLFSNGSYTNPENGQICEIPVETEPEGATARDVVSYVQVALPDPRDRNQSIGARRVGRFGWKANVPSLVQFGVPGSYPFQPFSDFLLHDMGSLGDGIGRTGDDEPTTRLMRTAPLWGARFNVSYLHDGRALDIESAIEWHDGQAARSRHRFMRLEPHQQEALIRYVLSL